MLQNIPMLGVLAKGTNYLFGGLLKRKSIFIGSSLVYLKRDRVIDRNYFDYIRLATLELISHEIKRKDLSGNVAELGVYKGKFSRYINQYFPDRLLYLFDTFEGFDKRDIASDTSQKLSSGDQDFTDTSIESVIRLMPFPEKCKPVKGYFPESARDIDDRFVFVSLDADLFDPIYSGLSFFIQDWWPAGIFSSMILTVTHIKECGGPLSSSVQNNTSIICHCPTWAVQ